jgi:hypothetical protein
MQKASGANPRLFDSVTHRCQAMEIVVSNNGSAASNQALLLFYGSARAPLAYVIPDPKYPGGVMWRVALPDGRISEMTNLARAKDMATVFAERGPPHRDFKLLRWQYDHLETPNAGHGCVPDRTPYSDHPLTKISTATRPAAEESGSVPGAGPRRQVA